MTEKFAFVLTSETLRRKNLPLVVVAQLYRPSKPNLIFEETSIRDDPKNIRRVPDMQCAKKVLALLRSQFKRRTFRNDRACMVYAVASLWPKAEIPSPWEAVITATK